MAHRLAPGWIDLHVHSTCSADGESSISDHARHAARRGFRGVCFCEHADFDPRDWSSGHLTLARYDAEVAAAREAVPTVQLWQGVEITYQAGQEEKIRAWLAGHDWDCVVASVHLVDYPDGWALVSEPATARPYLAGHSQWQAYLPYFEELLRSVCSGLGDVVGHFDLVKRYGTAAYGPFQPACFEDEIRAVLRAMVERGVGLELNTSGLRQAPGEPYPALSVLRWYRQLGGELLTLGSDAHHVKDLGDGIGEARELARAAGFQAVATFEQRRPRWIDLDRIGR